MVTHVQIWTFSKFWKEEVTMRHPYYVSPRQAQFERLIDETREFIRKCEDFRHLIATRRVLEEPKREGAM